MTARGRPGHGTAAVTASIALAACGPSPPAASDWLGRWTGPEGTYVDIRRTDDGFELTIANLDGPRTFAGEARSGGIVFVRDGIRETISPTDGAGTGMKWLADASNCLVIRRGEGFCRD